MDKFMDFTKKENFKPICILASVIFVVCFVIAFFCAMNDKFLISVCKDNKWGYITVKNKVVIPLIYEYTSDVNDGVAAVCKGFKCGAIDKKGNLRVPLEYDMVFDFVDGLAMVSKDNELGYINVSNKLVIPFKPIVARSFSEDLAAVSEDGEKWGFINKKGKTVIDYKYDEVKDFHNGYAAFRIDDKWGAIDKRGKEVIEAKYYALGEFENNQITACTQSPTEKQGFCGVMKKNGKEVIPFKYFWVNPYYEGFYIAQDKQPASWIYIDKHGKIPFGRRFDVADDYYFGLAMVCETVNKCGFIDKKGKMVVKAEYEALSSIHHGVAAALKDGKWGLINRKGKVIIPFQYDWTGLVY